MPRSSGAGRAIAGLRILWMAAELDQPYPIGFSNGAWLRISSPRLSRMVVGVLTHPGWPGGHAKGCAASGGGLVDRSLGWFWVLWGEGCQGVQEALQKPSPRPSRSCTSSPRPDLRRRGSRVCSLPGSLLAKISCARRDHLFLGQLRDKKGDSITMGSPSNTPALPTQLSVTDCESALVHCIPHRPGCRPNILNFYPKKAGDESRAFA
jgi:hypothetical protein